MIKQKVSLKKVLGLLFGQFLEEHNIRQSEAAKIMNSYHGRVYDQSKIAKLKSATKDSGIGRLETVQDIAKFMGKNTSELLAEAEQYMTEINKC